MRRFTDYISGRQPQSISTGDPPLPGTVTSFQSMKKLSDQAANAADLIVTSPLYKVVTQELSHD